MSIFSKEKMLFCFLPLSFELRPPSSSISMPGILAFYERVKGDAAKTSFPTSPFPRFFSAEHYTPLLELSTLPTSLVCK